MPRKRRHAEPQLFAEGVAHCYHDYRYKVYRDGERGVFHIVFDGRFAPFATVEKQHEIADTAQAILESFLHQRVKELGVAAAAMLGIEKTP